MKTTFQLILATLVALLLAVGCGAAPAMQQAPPTPSQPLEESPAGKRLGVDDPSPEPVPTETTTGEAAESTEDEDDDRKEIKKDSLEGSSSEQPTDDALLEPRAEP